MQHSSRIDYQQILAFTDKVNLPGADQQLLTSLYFGRV